MEEAIKKQALEVLGDATVIAKRGVAASVKLVQEQAPDLCRQICTIEIVYCALWFLFGVLLAVVAYLSVTKLRKTLIKDCKYTSDVEFITGLTVTMSIVTGVISVPFIFCNIFWVAKVVLAPKIYLIEYFTNLIK